mgnify:CR=1 FL=1
MTGRKRKVAVIGALNVDIGGRPLKRPVAKDSNPGKVSVRPGGVGRNIAHNLRLLGLDVKLLSAVGADEHGGLLLQSCAVHGIDTSLCLRAEDENSSTYLYITDEHGEMQLAVADMDVTARLTPAVMAERLADGVRKAERNGYLRLGEAEQLLKEIGA